MIFNKNKIILRYLCLCLNINCTWFECHKYNSFSLVLITYIYPKPVSWTFFLYFSFHNTFSFPNPDNVNGNLDVCNRYKRGGTGGWKLFHDIKVSVVYLFAFFSFSFHIFSVLYLRPKKNISFHRSEIYWYIIMTWIR